MKKIIYAFAASALFLSVAVSCQKAEIDNPTRLPEQAAQEFSGILPATVSAPLSDQATKTGFTYDAENKVYNHYWEEGDEFNVYRSGKKGLYRAVSAADAKNGTFTLISESDYTSYTSDEYLALYPTTMVYNSNGTVSAQIYNGTDNQMVARSSTPKFAFTTVFGWLKFQFTGYKKVNNVTVYCSQSNDNCLLNGDFDISQDGNVVSRANMEMPVLSNNYDDEVELSPSEKTDFYMAMLPGTYGTANSNSLSVDVMFTDGTRSTFTCPDLTVERNVVTPLAVRRANMNIAFVGGGSERALANCYHVTSPNGSEDPDEQVYCIPAAFKGNDFGAKNPDNDLRGKGVRAGVLWETKLLTNQGISEGAVIKDVMYNSRASRIYFTVVKANKGNALIALYDENDEILWSWHIWVTTSELNHSTYTYDGKTVDIMAWNLGRLNNSDLYGPQYTGLFYQWGRKDPFYNDQGTIIPYATASLVPSNGKATVAQTAANPTTFYKSKESEENKYTWNSEAKNDLWSNTGKTLYDPCPYGWRVLSSTIAQELYDRSEHDTVGRVTNATDTSLEVNLCGFMFRGTNSINPSSAYVKLGNDGSIYTWLANSTDGKQAAAINYTTNGTLHYLIMASSTTGSGCHVRCMRDE